MGLFHIEVTDTFGGEANYAWATHHLVKGKSRLGAMQRFSRISGMNWHDVGCDRYDSKSGATCLFIEEFDHDVTKHYRFSTDDRT